MLPEDTLFQLSKEELDAPLTPQKWRSWGITNALEFFTELTLLGKNYIRFTGTNKEFLLDTARATREAEHTIQQNNQLIATLRDTNMRMRRRIIILHSFARLYEIPSKVVSRCFWWRK